MGLGRGKSSLSKPSSMNCSVPLSLFTSFVIQAEIGLILSSGCSSSIYLAVDFIVEIHDTLFAIEVKSGHKKTTSGLLAFSKKFPNARLLQIGEGGVTLEQFFTKDLFSA